ncbi:adenosylmethionine--8-amino-7-oxononanoate transaminase [Luteibaculum oceani]|uniref:Adenosylmethionine-8-amino-7-oxononanoate aminotransferase n=1 Tax=Luteibaculum oceani TaxID=1294296 RepID=A0A5C6V5E2_9FLAO|nr:adenosylmethionine--8-amino-7-oxononanoate transaminase [Luteibaculum oceani]TXC78835.1 adenosylmethionine--8-amino-7-oxononanoate transaminase [Luteibaculum oceani]
MIDLKAEDLKHVWHPFSPLKSDGNLPVVTKGEGVYLELDNGARLIDAISSWWVNPLGHAHKEIADAVYKQMLTLEHVIFAGFTHEPAIQLSKTIKEIAKHPFDKVFFSDNGSTAVEVALKLAIQYFSNLGSPRKGIVSFKDAYHGDTFGAMAVGQKGTFFKPFEDFVFQVHQIEVPTEENFEELKKGFTELVSSKDIAAFIFEPLVLGAGGMKMYSPEFLAELMNIAKSYGTICIADEVMTGFGRTGKMFATDHLEIAPDLMAVSKCLTGGFMPLSLTLANKKITEAFNNDQVDKVFYHGHSYTANPVGCAAANKTLEILSGGETKKNWERIENKHKGFIPELTQFNKVKNIRLRGTILAFDVQDKSEGYFSDIKEQLKKSFIADGVLLRPLGNTVYIMPPYIISNEQLDTVYGSIKNALQKI